MTRCTAWRLNASHRKLLMGLPAAFRRRVPTSHRRLLLGKGTAQKKKRKNNNGLKRAVYPCGITCAGQVIMCACVYVRAREGRGSGFVGCELYQ